MHSLSVMVLAVLAAAAATTVGASIVPINPIPTTFGLPAPPVATSYQVVTRNVNRVAVPHVHPAGYPGYPGIWAGYPYNYQLGYGYSYPYNHVHNFGYDFGYPYGYGTTVCWIAIWYVGVIIFPVIATVAGIYQLDVSVAPSAPAAIVAAPTAIATAISSQVFTRNYNGIATAPVVAPVVAKAVTPIDISAPVVDKPIAPVSFAVPIERYAAATYSTPFASFAPVVVNYVSCAGHSVYSAPLHYPAAPVLVLRC